MRKSWGLVGATVLLLAGSSCDSTQPVDAGVQTFSLGVQAFASTNLYDVWDATEDTDFDGTPDTPAGLLCLETAVTTIAEVPWNYAAQISIIRAGTTTEEVIATSIDTLNDFSSRTAFDEVIFAQRSSFSSGNFFYTNGRSVSASHRDVIEGIRTPQRAPVFRSQCLQLNLTVPQENVLGSPGTFDVPMSQGDTVVVRARKQLNQVADLSGRFNNNPQLGALTFLEGRAISPIGTTGSTTGDGSGFSFSFTLR